MYSNISDCDEGETTENCCEVQSAHYFIFNAVYNFWEPMHYLDRGYGFQTWEVSPQYAIRSWAYIVLHWWPVSGLVRLLGVDKVSAHFTLFQ